MDVRPSSVYSRGRAGILTITIVNPDASVSLQGVQAQGLLGGPGAEVSIWKKEAIPGTVWVAETDKCD